MTRAEGNMSPATPFISTHPILISHLHPLPNFLLFFYHKGKEKMKWEKVKYVLSIAQIPVPVPTSNILCGFSNFVIEISPLNVSVKI
jgi:hypothetical protein